MSVSAWPSAVRRTLNAKNVECNGHCSALFAKDVSCSRKYKGLGGRAFALPALHNPLLHDPAK
jgi:hypothetical protein